MRFINTSAYQFLPLSDLDALRAELFALGEELGIKGTILLSPEGINCTICAQSEAMLKFKQKLDERFDLPYKDSESDFIPFKRFLIKIKSEIITFKQKEINPAQQTSPHLAPETLKAWLDEGREVVILDTRNRFELDYGKFTQAIDLSIDNFTEFADAIANLPESMKSKPVVTYCTGGVRCEKAAPLLEAHGFKHVYQIDGGILNYFEQCGDAHYSGNCFVFDERISLTPSLAVSGEA